MNTVVQLLEIILYSPITIIGLVWWLARRHRASLSNLLDRLLRKRQVEISWREWMLRIHQLQETQENSSTDAKPPTKLAYYLASSLTLAVTVLEGIVASDIDVWRDQKPYLVSHVNSARRAAERLELSSIASELAELQTRAQSDSRGDLGLLLDLIEQISRIRHDAGEAMDHLEQS